MEKDKAEEEETEERGRGERTGEGKGEAEEKAEERALVAAKAKAEKAAKGAVQNKVLAVDAKPSTLKVAPTAKAKPASGAPAELGVKTEPFDIGVAVRSGALGMPRGIDLTTARVPSSIGVDLPVVGPVRIDLAVSIVKTSAQAAAESDVVVTLPKNLVMAAKRAAGGDAGIALDVPGVTSGRFNLDISTPRKGEADVVITSKLIPKLPLQKTKGAGGFCFECGDGGEQSEWFVTRNLGNGIQFYSNAITGESQFELPKGF